MIEETDKQRIDRELIELLNELRVALPGVQVMFAFLLTVPFTQRFEQLASLRRDAYFGTFVCTALATVLLIAPSAQHRLLFRQRQKERLLISANRLAIAGLTLLALATTGTVFLITDVLFHLAPAAGAAGGIAGTVAWFWYVSPIRARLGP